MVDLCYHDFARDLRLSFFSFLLFSFFSFFILPFSSCLRETSILAMGKSETDPRSVTTRSNHTSSITQYQAQTCELKKLKDEYLIGYVIGSYYRERCSTSILASIEFTI